VRQGSEITVPVVNDGDVEATVHWHGLRLDNRYDGVPYQTQPPIPVGESFAYRVRFPDAGVYWYHPHIREDYTLEHRTPDRVYRLAAIAVTNQHAVPSLARQFEVLRADPELAVERQRLAPALAAPPDKILALVAEMDMGGAGHHMSHGGLVNESTSATRDWGWRTATSVSTCKTE
jgi:multicopper oxidase